MVSDRYAAWRALLIRRREARRWTQGELAERSGMDRSLVWRLEHGVKDPTLLSVEKLASGLQLAPRERDRFYLAAGYAMANPLSALAGHDGWLLHELYDLLGDGRLDERAGRALRDGLAMLVEEAHGRRDEDAGRIVRDAGRAQSPGDGPARHRARSAEQSAGRE